MTQYETSFPIESFTYDSDQNWVSEGLIIASTIIWVVGVVNIYVWTMCGIKKYFKRK